MGKTIKIVIVGIGGVGGYFGGLLARRYQNDGNIEVIFIARGAHLHEIQKSGLRVIKGQDEFVAVPSLATDDANAVGIADFIIVCTKAYSLDLAIEQIKPCVGPDTVLLPLLNGVDAVERILEVLPDAKVISACAYIVARLKEPGVVENVGNIQKLIFGVDGPANDQLKLLEQIFTSAGIEATMSNNISSVVWEKFIFIAPTATATSYFDLRIGQLVTEKEGAITALIEEVAALARAKGIMVDSDIVGKTLNKLRSLPYEATSSLHSDFLNGKSLTELETLTGYVVREGIRLGIPTPAFSAAYIKLLSK